MNSIKTRKTVTPILTIPSTFGMPACGHAFGTTADVISGSVRDGIRAQAEVRVKGDMGSAWTALAVRTYPGTSAWRPPSS